MTQLTLTIKDKSKIKFLLELLGELDYVEIESDSIDPTYIDKMLQVSEDAISYGKVTSQTELEKEIKSWKEK